MNFKTRQISSLSRVFLDGNCALDEICSASALKGERYSYQIAYQSEDSFTAEISVESPLSQYISIREVGSVPSELPVYKSDCGYYERTEPGLFPDVLYPIKNDSLLVKRDCFYSLWVTAELPENIDAGEYGITIKFLREGEELSSDTFYLKVVDAVLPAQTLIYTQWFHCDGIAQYYNAPVFGEKFWRLTEEFIKTAVHTGINMLLTPVITPPLDTAVGGERLTVQLADVKICDGQYYFNFDKFKKWVGIARKNGIKYFEISHLFSQWGAKYAPKIVAELDGTQKKIFGWETSADSPAYKEFLKVFLPELIAVIRSLGIEKSTFFHISDEPNKEQAASYKKAKEIIAPLVEGFPVIDALSDYEYYKNGLVSHPIPGTDEIENFIKKGFPHPWTYYCCSQREKLSNRFFGTPLSAERAIGLQFYKFGIEGFLQWGYNFYNSRFSLRSINPFCVTDADGAFPSGDAFSVYPGESGALESIRSVVFYEALQDMRALQLLGSLLGRDKCIFLIENKFGKITFTQYPRQKDEIIRLREFINKAISESIKKECP